MLSVLRISLFLALTWPSFVWAQATVLQGGPWAAGHAPVYAGDGGSQPVIMDSGGAGGGVFGQGLSELGITSRSATGAYPAASSGSGPFGTHSCMYDAPVTNSTGYHYLCFDSNANGGGMLAYGASGGAGVLPFALNVNGTTYSFPGPGTGTVVGPTLTTLNDFACWNNTTGTLLKDCGAIALMVPSPTPTTLGGVFATSAPSNQFMIGVNSSGMALFAQPSFANVSGTIAAAQLIAPTASTLGAVLAQSSYNATTGLGGAANIVPGAGVATALQASASGSGGMALTAGPAFLGSESLASLTTGGQALITLSDNGVNKWQFGKQSDNSFIIYDIVANRTDLYIASNGDMQLMPNSGAVTSMGTFNINPTAKGLTTTMGLNITQTGPNSGSIPTVTTNYNSISVTEGVNESTGGTFANALYILLSETSNAGGQKAALYVDHERFNATASTGDEIGIVSFTRASASDGGTSGTPKGSLYAENPIVELDSGATYYQIISGMEIDVVINTGASSSLRYGMDIVSAGPVAGSVQDAAIAIATGGGSAGWANALYLTQGNGSWGQPLATGGCVICTDGGTLSIATLIDVGTYTITSNVLNTKPLQIDSNGTIYFKRGGSAGSVPSISGHNGVSVAVGASLGVTTNTGLLALYRDATTGGTALVACEAGYGPTILWQSAANFTVTDPGAGGNKFVIQNASGHYCDILNRYTSAQTVSYNFITTDGAVAP